MEFQPHLRLSQLSQVEALQQLRQFRDNPWFDFLKDSLQSLADQAIASVADPSTILQVNGQYLQQQLIGASPAYIHMFGLLDMNETNLVDYIKHEQTQGHE